jgi:hypothetical protein
MTVAAIVASLLPIMWSTRTGAEVMKPLATPVIGGMGEQLDPHLDCNAGDLRVVARAGIEQGE